MALAITVPVRPPLLAGALRYCIAKLYVSMVIQARLWVKERLKKHVRFVWIRLKGNLPKDPRCIQSIPFQTWNISLTPSKWCYFIYFMLPLEMIIFRFRIGICVTSILIRQQFPTFVTTQVPCLDKLRGNSSAWQMMQMASESQAWVRSWRESMGILQTSKKLVRQCLSWLLILCTVFFCK